MLGHSRPLSTTFDQYRPLSTTLDHSRPLSPTFAHSRPLSIILDHSRPLKGTDRAGQNWRPGPARPGLAGLEFFGRPGLFFAPYAQSPAKPNRAWPDRTYIKLQPCLGSHLTKLLRSEIKPYASISGHHIAFVGSGPRLFFNLLYYLCSLRFAFILVLVLWYCGTGGRYGYFFFSR
jgi:hypothetical protein